MANLGQTVALRIRQERIRLKWTQEELADRTGLSVRYIGQLEREKASPTINALEKLARALRVDPGDFLRKS